MTGVFEERERGYEAKWAHDEEAHFAIMAKRNAWLGEWACETMQLPKSEADRYVQAVIDAGLTGRGKDPVFEKISRRLRRPPRGLPRLAHPAQDERNVRTGGQFGAEEEINPGPIWPAVARFPAMCRLVAYSNRLYLAGLMSALADRGLPRPSWLLSVAAKC